MPADTPLSLHLDPDALRPLVVEIVREVLAQTQDSQAQTAGEIALTEAEAARKLRLETHQLRDARLRGEVVASRITGRRIRYQPSDLIAYLTRTRTDR